MRQIYVYELKASFASFQVQLLERGLPCRVKALSIFQNWPARPFPS